MEAGAKAQRHARASGSGKGKPGNRQKGFGRVIISFSWPPSVLLPNAKRRSHWSVCAPVTKAYRRTCWATALEAGIGKRPEGPVPMVITFYPPDKRRRDRDGMIGAFKAGQDGLSDAMGVDDRWFRPSYHFGEPVKGGAVTVEMQPGGAIEKPPAIADRGLDFAGVSGDSGCTQLQGQCIRVVTCLQGPCPKQGQ